MADDLMGSEISRAKAKAKVLSRPPPLVGRAGFVHDQQSSQRLVDPGFLVGTSFLGVGVSNQAQCAVQGEESDPGLDYVVVGWIGRVGFWRRTLIQRSKAIHVILPPSLSNRIMGGTSDPGGNGWIRRLVVTPYGPRFLGVAENA